MNDRKDLKDLIEVLGYDALARGEVLCFAHIYVQCLENLTGQLKSKAIPVTNKLRKLINQFKRKGDEGDIAFDFSAASSDYVAFCSENDNFPALPRRVLAWLMVTDVEDRTQRKCREECEKAGITPKALMETDEDRPPVGVWVDAGWRSRQPTISSLAGRDEDFNRHCNWLSASLRKGSHYMIEGRSGVGKSVFGRALLSESFKRWERSQDFISKKRRFLFVREEDFLLSANQVNEKLDQLYELLATDPTIIPVLDCLGIVLEGPGSEKFAELFSGVLYSEGRSFILVCETSLARRTSMFSRIKSRPLAELSRDETELLLSSVLPSLASELGMSFKEGTTATIANDLLDLSRDYFPGHYLPKIALTLASNLVNRANHRSATLKQEPIGYVQSKDLRDDIAEELGLDRKFLADDPSKFYELLRARLKSDVLGQDHAIEAICNHLEDQAGKPPRRTPRARFLLVGPSGVGKTETARCLARHLGFGDDSFFKFNMGEYATEMARTKFIGSDVGYIGSGSSETIFHTVQERPACVILLDEVDRCHPSVQDILLGILEGDGKDYLGRAVYFSHAVFIMTTNYGGDLVSDNYRDSRRERDLTREQIVEEFSTAHIRHLLATGVGNEISASMLEFVREQLGTLARTFTNVTSPKERLSTIENHLALREYEKRLEDQKRRTTLDTALLDRADAVLPYFPFVREDVDLRRTILTSLLVRNGISLREDGTLNDEMNHKVNDIEQQLPDLASVRSMQSYLTQNWRELF